MNHFSQMSWKSYDKNVTMQHNKQADTGNGSG